MLRPNADPENLQEADFLCNFCGRAWTPAVPMIEGHQGNLICGNCVTVAYREIVLQPAASPAPPAPTQCVMCLEERTERTWESPVSEGQRVCVRCVKQAAGALVKDKDSNWSKPMA